MHRTFIATMTPPVRRVIQRANEDRLAKCIFAFVLGLADRLFDCRVPSIRLSWSLRASSPSMRTWLDHFSLDWAISDWPGSLNNLFFAPEFIPDRKRRLLYLREAVCFQEKDKHPSARLAARPLRTVPGM